MLQGVNPNQFGMVESIVCTRAASFAGDPPFFSIKIYMYPPLSMVCTRIATFASSLLSRLSNSSSSLHLCLPTTYCHMRTNYYLHLFPLICLLLTPMPLLFRDLLLHLHWVYSSIAGIPWIRGNHLLPHHQPRISSPNGAISREWIFSGMASR